MSNTPIDTTNRYMVSAAPGRVVIINPPRGPVSKPDALVFAAWLVTMSGADREDFARVLDAVENT